MYTKSILIVLGTVVAGIIAAPADVPPEKLQPTVIPIVSQSEELEPNGTFKFSYETGNGIIREETAYEKVLPKARDASSNEAGEEDDSNEIHVQRGSYSYTAPDGTLISVSYIADENGFQPIGDHLPRSPVLVPSLNSAEKSSRALKLADSSESASAVATKIATKSTEVKKSESEAEPPTVDKSESAPVAIADEANPNNLKSTSDVKIESIPTSDTETQKISEPLSAIVNEQSNAEPAPAIKETQPEVGLSTTDETADIKSPVTEATEVTTEAAISATDFTTSESSEATTDKVEVSTEAASTASPTLATAETEQASPASADQASNSISETTAPDVLSDSSTLASEPAISGDVAGQSASTEAVNSPSTDEAGQSTTNAPELASTDESSSTTTAA